MQDLESTLAGLITNYLHQIESTWLDEHPDEAVPIGAPAPAASAENRGLAIARDLLTEATANGLSAVNIEVSKQGLRGGVTAMEVAEITGTIRVIMKLDESPELVEEAKVLRLIGTDELALPDDFRSRYPRVLAIRDHEPPYAYLMESFSRADGYRSLEEILYGSQMIGDRRVTPMKAAQLIETAMAPLFASYSYSIKQRSRPNIYEDYIARIRGRMDDSARIDGRFGSRRLRINGVEYAPWQEYFAQIAARPEAFNRLGPSFTCSVHGDPHAENVLVRPDGEKIEVRFIDPKTWLKGDWLFDVAKMATYVELRGPIERLAWSAELLRAEENDEGVEVDYQLHQPAWGGQAVSGLMQRSKAFATEHGDDAWEQRYKLAMVSNVLGLPAIFLKQGDFDRAMIYHAEGIRRLHAFCEAFAGF